MITPEYLRTMALYNRWQDEVLFGHCQKLSDDEAVRATIVPHLSSSASHAVAGHQLW
jgi:uncharacterized damage-inducible protein DinB